MRRRVRLAIPIAWLTVPLVSIWWFDGLFLASTLPKLIWLLVTGAVAAVALARVKEVKLRSWHLILAAFLVLELASIPRNWGTYLDRVGFTASLLVIAVWLEHAGITFNRVRLLIAWPVGIVIAGSLFAFFAHYNPFYQLDLLGSLIGHRNWVSLFLIASLPWFLLSRRPSAHVLAVATTFVIVANRTRSAWVILGVYVVVLAALSVKRRQLRPALVRLAATSVLAIALVQVVPTRLLWSESKPYLASITSFASPEKWSGRTQHWHVALEMMRQHPLTGVGTGQFRVEFGEHMLLAGETSIGDPISPYAMNDYLHAGAERGLVGCVLSLILFAGWPLLLLWRASRLPGRRGAVCVIAALPVIGLGVGALGDAPFQRVETFAVFLCTLVPLQRRLAPIRLSWSGLRVRIACVSTLCACVVLAVLHLGSSVAMKQYLKGRDPEALEMAYRLWRWLPAYDAEDAMFDHQLREGGQAAAQELVRSRVRNWPDARASSSLAMRMGVLTGNVDDVLATASRQLQLYKTCPAVAWTRYVHLLSRSDFPRERKLSASTVQACVGDWAIPQRPEVQWATVQGRIEEWNGLPLVSANWTGSYRPHQVIGDRVVSVIDNVLIDPELQLYSPQPLSDHEIVLEVINGAYQDTSDLAIFDRTAQTLRYLTQTPDSDERGACVDRMRRRIAYRSDAGQMVVDLKAQRDAVRLVRPFQHCIFDPQGRLFGVDLETEFFEYRVWMCDPDERWQCRKLRAFVGARSVGSLGLLDGHVIASVTREGDKFRRIFRIAQGGDTLEPAPNVPAVDADVLEWDGTEARVGRNGREWLVAPSAHGSRDTDMIYASREISGTRYAIYANAKQLPTIARRDGASWTVLAGHDHAPAAEPMKVWIPVDNDRVQGTYYGSPSADRVVVWWHDGPSENVSPRYQPYFEMLNRIGFAVLAVNYSGSATSKHSLTTDAIARTVDAVLAYVTKQQARIIVSWSVAAGEAIQEVILDRKVRVSAIVEQAGSTRNDVRRRKAMRRQLPYFTIHGQFDEGAQGRHDVLYPGAQDVLRYTDFIRMFDEVKTFLEQVPTGTD